MTLHWPQLVMVVWIAAELGVQLAQHGKSKGEGTHSFPIQFVSWCIIVWLLWMGGFWGGGVQ